MKPKYSFEIDCSGYEADSSDYGRWAGYGTLVAEGNTLEELLDSASVDIIDQDGGELYCGPCDEPWVEREITEAYWKQNGKTLSRDGKETFNDFLARMEREQPEED